MASRTRDWDARTYHRVSAPHQEWAEELLERLALRGDETVLDAGCGSGRVTLKLLQRLPRGHVIAVDGAPSMVEVARAALPADRTTVFCADLLDLELGDAHVLRNAGAVVTEDVPAGATVVCGPPRVIMDKAQTRAGLAPEPADARLGEIQARERAQEAVGDDDMDM
jgi:SAM-dependent methyltransferase